MSQKTSEKITVYPLSLNGDTFNGFKSDFDQLLRQLITEMEKRESEDATISVKFSVKLAPDQARDFQANGYDGMRDIIKPSFKHEISTVMQVKNKKSGNVGGNMELAWDKNLHQYIMRPIDNGQTTFFDEDGNNTAEYVVAGEASGESGGEAVALEGAEPLGLPAPEAGDGAVIDAEVVEVPAYDEEAEMQKAISAGPAEVKDNPFDWLKQFLGQKLKVMEANGNYTARNAAGTVVFSSAVPNTSCQFCPAQILEFREGYTLEVCAHYDGTPDNPGNVIGISVWCEEDKITIAQFKAPAVPVDTTFPVDDEDYPYEDPQA